MAQTSFLQNFVEEVLSASGMSDLNEDQRKYYVPQITALLEERMGLEFLPKLNDKQKGAFAELAANDATTPEAWRDFWQKSIPNFEEEMKRILSNFAVQAKSTLGK